MLPLIRPGVIAGSILVLYLVWGIRNSWVLGGGNQPRLVTGLVYNSDRVVTGCQSGIVFDVDGYGLVALVFAENFNSENKRDV